MDYIDPETESMYMDEENFFMHGDEDLSDVDYDYLNEMYQQYMEEEEDMSYTPITFGELLDQCIIPTVGQTLNLIYPLMGLCLFMRVMLYICNGVLHGRAYSSLAAHTCSSLAGLLILHWFFKGNLLFLAMLSVLAYCSIYTARRQCQRFCGPAVALVSVVYLLTCEFWVVKQEEWHQLRGAQMVLAMKLISFAFDLDSGAIHNLPNIFEYFGYAFHVGTVVFGPWISYQDYVFSISNDKAKKLEFSWFFKLAKSLLVSFSCVIISTCAVHWLILDSNFVWILAYRDAQSFRFSHYFISFLSEFSATLSGFRLSHGAEWDLSVAQPYHIELPRSLVEVVTHWNLPMHSWLKTYVFKTSRRLGVFPAIIITYGASSLLHGMNFQLAAVLLSLGFFSYIEYVLRNCIAKAFNACVKAKRCRPECGHYYTAHHPFVILANLAFGLLSVFHLAYLGLLFDSSAEENEGYSMEHAVKLWRELGFASHWVALALYFFYLLI